ncbi:MAG: FAD-dependent oxidoreductase [Clostridiales bacterium]|nr:FAD-dependent oxidoreductase [Clostridiales bacterium]
MSIEKIPVDILIVGAGPAGLAAAISAREAGIQSIVVLEREDFQGGILQQCIHNGFGLHRFKIELTGPEYAQRDVDMAKELDLDIRTGVTVLEVSKKRLVTAISKEGGLQLFEAGAVILAMGCRERPRGALAIPGTRGAGIYSAGTAQRFVNLEGYMPGRRVVILGSGDIGLIMARRMTLQGAEVLACVELMPYSSGLNRNIVQCLQDYDIPLLLSHTVTDIQGRERVSSVTVSQVDENRKPIPGTEQVFECDTLLLSVGLIPENELSMGAGVEISPATSGAIVDNTLQTNIPGVFACGNVLHVHDLVDHVSEESSVAGRAAAAYVQGKAWEGTSIPVTDGAGVRGTVPQRLNLPDAPIDFSISLMFRPVQVFRNHYLVVKADDKVLSCRKSMILTPGEMASAAMSSQMLELCRGAKAVSMEISSQKLPVFTT